MFTSQKTGTKALGLARWLKYVLLDTNIIFYIDQGRHYKDEDWGFVQRFSRFNTNTNIRGLEQVVVREKKPFTKGAVLC